METFEVGQQAIATTCNGEFRVKVRRISTTFRGCLSYECSSISGTSRGDYLITNTTNLQKDDGRELFKGPTCDICPTTRDCCFSKYREA